MSDRNTTAHRVTLLMIGIPLMVLLLLPQTAGTARAETPPPASRAPQQKLQAMVMGMADEYIAALGEAMYLVTGNKGLDARGRWLAMSFMRNGVGASLDIGVGPNPSVNLLDLLVLTSLQSWSFQNHWIPDGIGDAGKPAIARLKQAEKTAWTNARKTLSDEQLRTLKNLIDTWITENPDRTVVALVRFTDFTNERKISSLSLRGQASGLLSEVSEVSAAVDDVRLLGDRIIWFAGRYPYLLGEQSELTLYRILDKPEVRQLVEAGSSAKELTDTLTKRIAAIDADLKEQREQLFKQLAAERSAAINQFGRSMDATVDRGFQRLAKERKELLGSLADHEKAAVVVMGDMRKTLAVSETTSREVAAASREIEKLLARYQAVQNSEKERLRLDAVRDTAVETGNSAEKLMRLLEKLHAANDANAIDRTLAAMNAPLDRMIDRAFWRIAALIVLLIGGLALLRIFPKR